MQQSRCGDSRSCGSSLTAKWHCYPRRCGSPDLCEFHSTCPISWVIKRHCWYVQQVMLNMYGHDRVLMCAWRLGVVRCDVWELLRCWQLCKLGQCRPIATTEMEVLVDQDPFEIIDLDSSGHESSRSKELRLILSTSHFNLSCVWFWIPESWSASNVLVLGGHAVTHRFQLANENTSYIIIVHLIVIYIHCDHHVHITCMLFTHYRLLEASDFCWPHLW